jgi:hypothetical protein
MNLADVIHLWVARVEQPTMKLERGLPLTLERSHRFLAGQVILPEGNQANLLP